MIGPRCTHSSGACQYLVFQDPSLSLLAVIMLIVMAMLQVRPCKMSQCCLPLQLCSNLHWLLLLLLHLSPGAQVWAAAVAGRASVHLCVWSRTEDWEHPGGAGSAWPPHLAVEWIHHGGVCSCALPSWLSSTQVKRKCWCLWQPLWFFFYPISNSHFWITGGRWQIQRGTCIYMAMSAVIHAAKICALDRRKVAFWLEFCWVFTWNNAEYFSLFNPEYEK